MSTESGGGEDEWLHAPNRKHIIKYDLKYFESSTERGVRIK